MPTDCQIPIYAKINLCKRPAEENLHLCEDRLYFVTKSFSFTAFSHEKLETLNV